MLVFNVQKGEFMNKVILIGNLTRDPELTETPSGVPVCRVTIAVSRDYADSQGMDAGRENCGRCSVLQSTCQHRGLRIRRKSRGGQFLLRGYG